MSYDRVRQLGPGSNAARNTAPCPTAAAGAFNPGGAVRVQKAGRYPQAVEEFHKMACKIITAVAGAILLGSATIASAHAPVFPQLSHAYRHFRHSPRLPYYGYHGHVPIFPPAIASGYAPLGVTAGAVASGYAPLGVTAGYARGRY